MSTEPLALAVIERSAELERFLPIMDIATGLKRREILVEAFKTLLKKDEDYGVIPGSKKPTLLQPGAQKLDNLFGLVARYEVIDKVEDWTGVDHAGEPFFRYMIRCQVMRGEFVMGEGIGECNSWESKYRYRTADRVCPNCGRETIIFTKKNNWWCNKHKGGCGVGFKADDQRLTSQETGRKPNPEIFDQVNTFLKIGEKRAHLLATINATSASEFVSQDLDDFRAEPEQDPQAEPGGSDTGREAVPPKPSPDDRTQGVAGHAAGTSSATFTRPVPEELTLAFKRIGDKVTGAVAETFKFIEGELVAEYSRNGEGKAGLDLYTGMVLEWRDAHPGNAAKDIGAIKGLLLDLWDTLVVIRDSNAAACDEVVPTLDEMKQGKLGDS